MEQGVNDLTGISDAIREDVGELSLSQIVKSYVDALGGIRPAATFFGVNPGVIAYALDHEPKRTSMMGRALVKRGVLRTKQTRLSASVTEEQRRADKELMAHCGTTWTEFARALAVCWTHRMYLADTMTVEDMVKAIVREGGDDALNRD